MGCDQTFWQKATTLRLQMPYPDDERVLDGYSIPHLQCSQYRAPLPTSLVGQLYILRLMATLDQDNCFKDKLCSISLGNLVPVSCVHVKGKYLRLRLIVDLGRAKCWLGVDIQFWATHDSNTKECYCRRPSIQWQSMST